MQKIPVKKLRGLIETTPGDLQMLRAFIQTDGMTLISLEIKGAISWDRIMVVLMTLGSTEEQFNTN